MTLVELILGGAFIILIVATSPARSHGERRWSRVDRSNPNGSGLDGSTYVPVIGGNAIGSSGAHNNCGGDASCGGGHASGHF